MKKYTTLERLFVETAVELLSRFDLNHEDLFDILQDQTGGIP